MSAEKNRTNPYNDSYTYTKSLLGKKTDRFLFSAGDLELLDRYYLPMTNPAWNFTSADYNCGDDADEEDLKTDVDEEALDLMISRVIWSAAANDGDDDYIGINAPFDSTIDDIGCPVPCLISFHKEKKNKARKSRRRTPGKNSKEDAGADATVTVVRGFDENGVGMVVMPLEQYRSTMVAEIDSMARKVHGYFEQQLKDFDTLRLNSLRDAFYWNERSRTANIALAEKDKIISSLSSELSNIQSKIEGDRTQKRQRRQDRKQRRKSEKTSPLPGTSAQSNDYVNSCDADVSDTNHRSDM